MPVSVNIYVRPFNSEEASNAVTSSTWRVSILYEIMVLVIFCSQLQNKSVDFPRNWKFTTSYSPIFSSHQKILFCLHNNCSCLYLQSHWLLQFTVSWAPNPPSSRLRTRQPDSSLISLAFLTYQPTWPMSCAGFLLPLAFGTKYCSWLHKFSMVLLQKYLCDLVQKPIWISSLSSRPLRSADRLDLLVPWTRTALAQHRAFASMGPSMWNGLPPAICSKIVTGLPPSFFLLLAEDILKSLGLPRWQLLWIASSIRGALQILKIWYIPHHHYNCNGYRKFLRYM